MNDLTILIEIKDGKPTIFINPYDRRKKVDRNIDDIFIDVFRLQPHIHPRFRCDD
jgi:hypothetical protein